MLEDEQLRLAAFITQNHFQQLNLWLDCADKYRMIEMAGKTAYVPPVLLPQGEEHSIPSEQLPESGSLPTT
jgi:hypothetical protein